MVNTIFMSFVILAAQHKSFVYGFNELCGVKSRCIVGKSRTASGEILSKKIPSIAIPLPKNVPLEVTWIGLSENEDGEDCTPVKINDRTSTRLVHKRGFDLSPAALKAITGRISKTWSGKLYLCDIEENEE